MSFKVVRIIKKEDILAEGLAWEDAMAIMGERAKNQLSRNYSYEVRFKDGTMRNRRDAHGAGSQFDINDTEVRGKSDSKGKVRKMSCENCKWDNPEDGVCRNPNDDLCLKEGVAPDGSYWCYEVRLSEGTP